jgi:hypothetical protein
MISPDKHGWKTSISKMRYPTIQLTEIPLRELTPYNVTLAHFGTQDHCRWVLRDVQPASLDTLFYKVWNPTYVRRDNILAAIEATFYDEQLVPALSAVIVHKGLCRGYVMKQGLVDDEVLTPAFRDLVYARTRQTGYFNVQFGYRHAMQFRGTTSLFDLEGAYRIQEYPILSKYHCRFADPDYEKLVAGMYASLLSDAPSLPWSLADARNFEPGDIARKSSPEPPAAVSGPSRLYGNITRPFVRKLRKIRPRMDLIEF